MLVMRALLLLGGLTVLLSLVAFLITRDWRYLRFAWQLIKFAGVLLLVFAGLWALGRMILL